MSCNGCRVLRKGCSESCILRPCLQWIETAEAQGHATVFVAKFFGRAGLMSFISAVPESQRPALFQSLLFEACGRTVNPVNGAVGLLGTGNWHMCQAAVETILRGGTLRPIPELLSGGDVSLPSPISDEVSEICTDTWKLQHDRTASAGKVQNLNNCRFSTTTTRSNSKASPLPKRKRLASEEHVEKVTMSNLDLTLNSSIPSKTVAYTREMGRPETPSMNSEESGTTSCWESGLGGDPYCYGEKGDRKLLNLFV